MWAYEIRMTRRNDLQAVVKDWFAKGLAKEGRNQTDLAKAMGVEQPRISEIKAGKRRVRLDELPKAARYFDEPVPEELLSESATPSIRAPLIAWVSAGAMRGNDLSDEQLGVVSAFGLPPGDWIALRVEGDSMDRISPPGSIIFVNRKDKRLVGNALYVIDDGEGNATYKRFRPGKTGPRFRFEPVSANADLDALFPENEPTIIGRVRRTMLDM